MSTEDLPKMQYRFLGRSGLKVSAISLGGWLTYGGTVENEGAHACMKAAFDVGINFFDCAEVYSSGKSEIVMGEAIEKFKWKRSDLVISTKIYWGGYNGTMPVNNSGLSRKHLVEGLNQSLGRLGLDYVDLVYAHRPDRDTPMEETVRAFNHLIDSGKAFYWGTSMWRAEEIAAAWRVAEKLNMIGPLMEQPEYNMLVRDKVEKEYELLYEHYGTGLTVFSPIKGGILSGKYNDGIPDDSRIANAKDSYTKELAKTVGDEAWEKQTETVRKLKPIAEKLDCDQAALALAWVLRNPRVSSAITGASRVEQIYRSVHALTVVPKLTDEVMAEIDEILGNKPAVLTRRFF